MSGPEHDKQRLEAHFALVDRDGNGTIDASEFEELLRRLGLGRSPEVVAHAFRAIDADGNGTIDYEEFCRWWTRGKRQGATDEAETRDIPRDGES